MAEVVIGRQEILDGQLGIYAYELLFRGRDFDLATKEGASGATAQIITDTLLEVGLNAVVGDAKAFINFTAQNLREKIPLYLPKDRVVVEVLEDVAVDLRIINNLKEIKVAGYTLALDDFEMHQEWEPLLELADIVKLDVLARPVEDTLAMIKKLKKYNVTLLAEKVETNELYELFREAGCELFQGFFFNKPKTVAGRRLGINQLAAIKLLTKVNDPDVSFDELATIISQDAGLSFKLLRYINSAFFGLPNKIDSLPNAVSYLGLNEVRRWVNILTLTSLSGKPGVQFQQALVRGKMCELVAKSCGEPSGNLFLIGMLSCIDAILDIPIEHALEQIPVGAVTVSAILSREGVAGSILADVISYEQWKLTDANFQNSNMYDLGRFYLESIGWAGGVLGQL